MELHQLRYFCAVAETGSFSRAAERSHVAQPSLSQQILKLEDELGARLFDRLGRSVRLTDLGKAFLPRARAVLRELEAAKGDVVERKDSITGSLSVGVIPTIAPYLLPEVTPALSKNWPKLKLVFREEKTEQVVRDLESGALDAGLVALEADLGDLAREVVMKDPFVVALPRGHALAKKKTDRFASMRDMHRALAQARNDVQDTPAPQIKKRSRSASHGHNGRFFSLWRVTLLPLRVIRSAP